MKWIDRHSTLQVALLAVGIFVLLYAWAGIVADAPDPDPLTPQTIAPAVPTEVDGG